jgi:hypothetical protein
MTIIYVSDLYLFLVDIILLDSYSWVCVWSVFYFEVSFNSILYLFEE